MNLSLTRLLGKAIATQVLLCAALFFAATDVDGQQAAPLDPRERQMWNQYGFSPEDGAEWKHAGFTPVEAREWVRAGIPYAQWADQWRGEGFGPGQAREWVEKVNVYTASDFRKFGFGSKEALEWIGHGIRSGLRAKEFRDGHFTAAQAGPWWKHEFFRMRREYGGMPALRWKRRLSGNTGRERRITCAAV